MGWGKAKGMDPTAIPSIPFISVPLSLILWGRDPVDFVHLFCGKH
jgi:hypothetical protein